MIPAFPPGTVVVLTTRGDDGPYAIPVSAIRRDGEGALLLALAPGRGSLARLRDDPAVAVTVLAPGVASTVRGRARVVADRLPGAEFMAAVRIAARAVDDALTPRTIIDGGVRWRWASPSDAARDAQVHVALARLAGVGG